LKAPPDLRLGHPAEHQSTQGTVRARTPLRISFAGGGTDVPPFPETEGGAVLSATIDRYVLGSLAAHADSHLRIESRDYGVSVQLAPDEGFEPDGNNLDLVKAALRRGWREGPNGYGITLSTSAPPGSGLGASSAMVVTVVAMLNEYYGMPMGEYEVAHLASVIEREDMKIAGGLQDYYAAAFGGFNYIEFGEQVVVNPLRVRDHIISELEMNLVLCFTGGTRRSDHIISDQTERYTRSEKDALAGLREQKELALAMKAALLKGRLDDFGWLLGQAWQAKKKMSPRITTPLINEIYEVALQNGAAGGKVTGAGGGGFMLLYVDFENRPRVAEALERLGVTASGFSFAPLGVRAWKR
jgi:D-glycero-alpha-D-manno-heptose-7-phosphate kinase